MRVNKYAEYNEKSFLNGAQFSDRPLIKTNQFCEDVSGISPRAFNLPVYPPPPPSLDYRDMGYVTPVEDQGKIIKIIYIKPNLKWRGNPNQRHLKHRCAQ